MKNFAWISRIAVVSLSLGLWIATTATPANADICCTNPYIDGSCADTDPESCTAEGGLPFNPVPGLTCAEFGNVCELYVGQGACCETNRCAFRTETECANFGGTFKGVGASCSPEDGEPACPGTQLGACCTADSCSDTTPEFDCRIGADGIHLGPDTVCGVDACPVPTSTTTLAPTTTTTFFPTTTTSLFPTTTTSLFPTTTTSTTSTTTSTTSTTLPVPGCGNGLVEAPEECDDANTTDGDGCSADCEVEECWECDAPGDSPSSCTPSMDAAPCDDGDECTVGDRCTGGVCGGDAVLIPAACDWVMVGGDPTRDVQSRLRGATVVAGDVCGDTVRVGLNGSITGDAVAVASSGRGAFFGPSAILDGDVLTGGSSVFGKPRGTLLPGLVVSEVAGMTPDTAQSGNPDNVYNTESTSPRIAECTAAQAEIDTAATTLDALPATQTLGDVRLKGNQSQTYHATVPGGLNVLDFDRLRTGNKVTITLDGAGNPDSAFVIRVDRKLDIRFQSQIVLANGASPERVIIYGRSKCRFGIEVVGAGTVVCPEGKLLLSERTDWTGSLMGGRKIVQLKDSGVLTHAPLQIGQ